MVIIWPPWVRLVNLMGFVNILSFFLSFLLCNWKHPVMLVVRRSKTDDWIIWYRGAIFFFSIFILLGARLPLPAFSLLFHASVHPQLACWYAKVSLYLMYRIYHSVMLSELIYPDVSGFYAGILCRRYHLYRYSPPESKLLVPGFTDGLLTCGRRVMLQ